MEITKAVKKLSKYTNVKVFDNMYIAKYKGYTIQFYTNGDTNEVLHYYVIQSNKQDDSMTDSFYGIHLKTINKSIDYINRMNNL
jgi:hypothetical protein